MRVTTTILAAVAAAAISAPASGASLDLATTAPLLESSLAFVDYFEIGDEGDLSAFGAFVDFADGVSPGAFAEIGFGFGFSLADPTDAAGGFDVFDENGEFLAGELLAVGYTDSVIELLFGNLAGAAAGSFGASVLATIAFSDPLGPDPFAAFADGSFYEASIRIARVAPPAQVVPLPAGLPLLLSALAAGHVLVRRAGRGRAPVSRG